MIPENKLFAESPAPKRTSCVAWITSALALAASFAASADTIAWWHFDECDPGTTAPADTVASDQAPTTYAHVYTIGGASQMSYLNENGGKYLPTYAKPFRGLAVYDPVSGATRTNHAAMKFRVDRGGTDPNSNKGRAHYGGGLKFDGGYNLYQSLYNTSEGAYSCVAQATFVSWRAAKARRAGCGAAHPAKDACDVLASY